MDARFEIYDPILYGKMSFNFSYRPYGSYYIDMSILVTLRVVLLNLRLNTFKKMFDYSSSLENNKMLTNSSLNVRLFECLNVDITSNMFRSCHRPNKLYINIMIVGNVNIM